jgi:hypothetical protein
MALAGRILEVLGIVLLFFAAYFLAALLLPQGAWDLLRPAYLPASEILGVAGCLSLLAGIGYVRKDRQAREFNEAMARKNRSLRGTVHDSKGLPVAKASVDIFLKGSEDSERPQSLRTDAVGRFSADLPEGQYVLEVGVPEIGVSRVEAAITRSGNSPELEIKFDSPLKTPEA